MEAAMWTVFRKEFREGKVLLIVALAAMVLMPWFGRVLAPGAWDKDVNDICHSLMFGLFVPIYLAILAAGMVAGENLSLLRGLPIPPWRIAAGKLLYLGLNMMTLGAVSLPGLVESPKWMEGQDLLGVWGWCCVTLSFAVLTFALTTLVKKSAYAIFLAGVLIIGLFVKALLAAIRLGPAFISDPLMIALTALAFLIPIPAGIWFFHRLLKSRPLVMRAAALCGLYPLVIGLFFLKEPGWNKAMVMSNVERWLQISDSKFLIQTNEEKTRYVYDLATGSLEEFLLMGKDEYPRQADPSKQRLYYFNAKITKTEEAHTFYQWSALDLKSGKTEKLAFLPSYEVGIDEGIASWHTWEKMDRRTFGFQDLKSGRRFQYEGTDCLQTAKGRSGVLFEKQVAAEKIWYFVDFASAQPKEVFRGDYKAWPWLGGGCYYLYLDKKLYQWCPGAPALREFGEYRFKYEFGATELLLTRSKGYETTVFLWKEGRIVDRMQVPFGTAYPLNWQFQSIEMPPIMVCANNKPPVLEGPDRSIGILRIGQGDHLKWTPLPDDIGMAKMIHGTNKLLLSRGNLESNALALARVYLYDLETGRMKKLS
jgi:hypothetical protein